MAEKQQFYFSQYPGTPIVQRKYQGKDVFCVGGVGTQKGKTRHGVNSGLHQGNLSHGAQVLGPFVYEWPPFVAQHCIWKHIARVCSGLKGRNSSNEAYVT